MEAWASVVDQEVRHMVALASEMGVTLEEVEEAWQLQEP